MERRSFLRDAALLTAALPELITSTAVAQTAPPAAAPHIVAAGEDRFGEARSLGFSTILFKVATKDTAGGLFVIEHTHLTHGGPALHLHLDQEEWFYVLEGEVAFQIGDQRLRLGPGQSALAPRRLPHTFAPVSATPSRMLIAFTPAGRMEAYFREVHDPHVTDPAVWRRYGLEYIGPSPFWT
jgi:mannose-6-phosphate isomerase-like protein (cupin superfamily)